MSKDVPKSPNPKQRRVPISAAEISGDAQPPQADNLNEGDAFILGLGGNPKVSPGNQRDVLIAAATAGDVGAQCRMGDICRTGDEFTQQDYGEALCWYCLAAAQGDRNAQNNLGAMHQHAMGVPKDMAEAEKWYRLSAEQGLSVAQYNLGVLYLCGNGVEQDEEEAARWLHRAAAQGHIQALSELGVMYLFGRGVERRVATAGEMLAIAALQGDLTALGSLADYHEEIEREALSGNMLAALSLGKLFHRGLGVEQDNAKMLAWLLWGEERGDRDDDPDVREEVDDMRGFFALTLADDIKDEAWAIFNQMCAANPGKQEPVPKIVAGGG